MMSRAFVSELDRVYEADDKKARWVGCATEGMAASLRVLVDRPCPSDCKAIEKGLSELPYVICRKRHP
jgi:hypothetical protein